jgi:hypothetical protein
MGHPRVAASRMMYGIVALLVVGLGIAYKFLAA